MARSIATVTVTGDPLVTGTISLRRGANLASAATLYEVQAYGLGLLSYIAGIDQASLKSTLNLDGMVGITFDRGETSDDLFLTKDGVTITGVTLSTTVSSGTVSRSRSESSAAGFVAGVAIGVALAQ